MGNPGYDVIPDGKLDPIVVCGILNSTVVAMNKHFFGRLAGTEGNLKTEVVDVEMMLVPDPRAGSGSVKRRIKAALRKMAKRHSMNLPDEFALADRQELDDAVLELLGESDVNDRRRVRDELYAEMSSMYAAIRDKELLAIENKKRTKRGSKLSAGQIAEEVWDALDPTLIQRFPEDFFDPTENVDLVSFVDGKCKVVDSSLLGHVGIDMNGDYIELGDVRRADLAVVIFETGRRGQVPIPADPKRCREALSEYRTYHDQVLAEFTHAVAEKTANEKLQAKVVALLKHKLAHLEEPTGE